MIRRLGHYLLERASFVKCKDGAEGKCAHYTDVGTFHTHHFTWLGWYRFIGQFKLQQWLNTPTGKKVTFK